VPGLEVAVALIGALLVARLLWSRTFRDVLAGLRLRLGGVIAPGEAIVAGGASGVVERLGLVSVTLRHPEQGAITIPCGVLIATPIANRSRLGTGERVTARVRIPAAADARRVRGLLLQVAGAVPGLLRDPSPEIAVGETGSGQVELVLAGSAGPSLPAASVETELRLRVLDALAASGIPAIRSEHDIHLRDLDFVKAAIARAVEARQREREAGDVPPGDAGGTGKPGDPA
jgi:small-conductance mechanosensitive channel